MQNAVGVGETPTIAHSLYGANTTAYAADHVGDHTIGHEWHPFKLTPSIPKEALNDAMRRIKQHNAILNEEEIKAMAANKPTRRLVQVFIADPNENVPMEEALIYKGEQKFTDATDQELFFDIEIKPLLQAYNVKRITFINKKVKERVEHLEPAQIRDLKMVVVTIAEF